jgi:hypothetical protein
MGGAAFTLADIVARSGVAPQFAEPALERLVRDYRSELDVDERGNLIYRFDPALSAREDIVAADAARRRKARLSAGLIAFFKAWTVAVVVVYFIIYIVILTAIIHAALSKLSKSLGRNSDSSIDLGWSRWTSWIAPWIIGEFGAYAWRRARRLWNEETERKLAQGIDPYRLDALAEPQKPSLTERTWYYLFGSAGIARNPLEREKELLTYLRAKRGFISNADIVALLGVSYDEADAIGTRLVATYEGELDLVDGPHGEPVAIYRFPNLMVKTAPEVAREAARLGYLWQARERENLLRKHPSELVPALNTANIAFGIGMAIALLPGPESVDIGVAIGLIFFPLAFSTTFLALGLRRKLRESAGSESYEKDSMRLAIYQLLFTRRTAVNLPGDEHALALVGLGDFDPRKLAEFAPSLAPLIRAEVTNVGGHLELRAPRIWAELATVERLRSEARSNDPVGRTVFSTRSQDIQLSAAIDALPTPA